MKRADIDEQLRIFIERARNTKAKKAEVVAALRAAADNLEKVIEPEGTEKPKGALKGEAGTVSVSG